MTDDDTPKWKPAACTDCGAPHPSWSLDGPTGPWRCMSCHTVAASAAPPPPPFVSSEVETPPAVAGN